MGRREELVKCMLLLWLDGQCQNHNLSKRTDGGLILLIPFLPWQEDGDLGQTPNLRIQD
jgi:hypothetical protein